MKITLLLLIAFSSLVHSQTTTWKTYIVQSLLAGGSEIPVLVDDSGSRPSLPLGIKGSRFELWGYKLLNGVEVSWEILAVTEAGTYSPEVRVMNISTDDPFVKHPRTRVDKSFTLNLDISGLLPDDGVNPPASQMVLLEHHADLYEPGSYDGKKIESTKLVSSEYISVNGIHKITFNRTQIAASNTSDWMSRAGEERFIIYALADGDVKQRVLGGQSVITLPVTTGKINGIVARPVNDPNSYREIPNFTCDVNRLYPDGAPWVEVYQGEFSSTKRGAELKSSYSHNGEQTEPYKEIKYGDISPIYQPSNAGLYTFVLRYYTPFPGDTKNDGGTVLDHVTTSFENTISLRTMISTSE